MIKFSSTDDFNCDVEPVSLVTDDKQLTKRGSVKEQLKYEKTADQTDVHVIALGAYEGYGCFFEGAPVQTYTGIKPIERIDVGDLVLTKDGTYQKVEETFHDGYSGIQTEIEVSNLPDSIVSTGNHPYLCVRGEKITSQDRCSCFFDSEEERYNHFSALIEKEQEWVAAQDLKPGDYLLSPIRVEKDPNAEVFTDDEAYLFGYYLSEGCLSKEYRKELSSYGGHKNIIFTMNSEGDLPMLAKLEEIITKLDRNYSVGKSNSSEIGVRITLGHTEYAKKLDKLFGHLSNDKFIHPLIFQQSREWILKFLAAYADGDGCVVSDANYPRYINTLTFSSASISLLLDIQRLLAVVGIASGITKSFNKVSNGCFGKIDHVIYQLAFGAFHSKKILDHCLRLKWADRAIPKKSAAAVWIVKDYLVYKITKVDLTEADNKTKYNLSVAGTNTFVVQNLVVHNSNRNSDSFIDKDCRERHHTFKQANRAVHYNHKNKSTDPKFGNIKASAYNENMKRIELIMGLDNDNPRNKEALEKLASGKQIQVSMACRVPYDTCTWCHHDAKDDRSRCEHIPSQLGELNKQGEMCAMQNYKPDWFEISIVGRPADRIGHSLNSSTVKEAAYKRMSTQDYLEMYPGFYCEENEVLTLSKKASNKRNLLKKLSEMEKKLDGIGQSKKTDFISRQASHLNKSPKISDFAIEEMRKHEPSKVFKATADKGIIFNPEEFIRYALGDAGTPDIAKGMRKHLPKGFSKAEDKGEPSTLHDEKYSPAELDFLPKGLKDLVASLTEGHSLFGEPSTRRVISITISSFGKAPEKKKEENTKESSGYNFEKLAQEYTNYKLAQLEYLDDQGKLDDIFLYNCLIQNRN